MPFFVDKLGPLPGQQARKEQKSAGSADLLKHPSKATTKQQAPQPAKHAAPARAQAERTPQPKVVDRAPPPKEEPKKKKGWFG